MSDTHDATQTVRDALARFGRGALPSAAEYRQDASRYSNEDGDCFEPSEIAWLCRLAPAAVAVRCADTAQERERALERLAAVVDELPVALGLMR